MYTPGYLGAGLFSTRCPSIIQLSFIFEDFPNLRLDVSLTL